MATTKIPAEFLSTNAIQGTLIADNAITTVHIAQNAITSVQIPNNSIGTVQIALNTVTGVHIAQNTITTTQLANNSVNTLNIADDQVTAAKLASDAVVTASIVDLNVTEGKIAANAITASKIPDGSITATQIGANAVTLAKMASLTRGSILVGDSAADVAALAIGTSGYVLKSDGTDAAWAADSVLTTEQVQDITGAMFSSNTETGIAATYQDGDGTIDLVIGANVIVAGMIAQNSILTRHIDDDQVTGAQLADNIAIAGTLGVAGNITQSTGDYLYTGGGNFDIKHNAASQNIVISTTPSGGSATSRMRITHDGKVGIGTDSPSQTLDVNGTIETNNLTVAGAQGSDGQVLTSTGSGVAWENSSGTTINNNADNRIITGSGTANTLEGEATVVIDSAGNMGIGETSPKAPGGTAATTLTVKASNYAQWISTVSAAATNSTTWRTIVRPGVFQIQTNNDAMNSEQTAYEIVRPDGSNEISYHRFLTGTTELLRLTSAGGFELNPVSGKTLTILNNGDSGQGLNFGMYTNHNLNFTTNNTVRASILAGGGLTFNGDTAAANALDDYEEGTWTPALDNITTNSSTMYGIYTKIGRIVHIHAKIAVTVASLPGAQFQISGLPFAATNTSDTGQRAIIAVGGDMANIGGNGTHMQFITNGSTLQGVWINSGTTNTFTYNLQDHTVFEISVHGHYTT